MKNRETYSMFASLIVILLLSVSPLRAEQAGGSASDLAKKSQNPVADMISLPLQYNTYLNTGPEGDRTQDVLLVQPVVPINLNDAWNFIGRPIIPVLNQPGWIVCTAIRRVVVIVSRIPPRPIVPVCRATKSG